VRDAVPAGVFTGKGKQLYDYLYLQTRGAIVPKMSARIPTETVMKGAGMTRHPFRAHIARLVSYGLLKVDVHGGGHGGNLYTVYLPEEADPGHRGDGGHTGDKVPTEQGSQGDGGDGGVSVDFQRTSDEPKTSFKTKTEKLDDEAAPFAGVIEAFTGVTKDLTGRAPVAADGHRWRELAEVLVMELRIAAGRTTVSSVPAFLTEHLRRRLWKLDKARPDASGGALESQQRASGASGEQQIDASKCPDCFGTGMHYPEGFDKGVARCRHSRLA
jgi:hypothetical protein